MGVAGYNTEAAVSRGWHYGWGHGKDLNKHATSGAAVLTGLFYTPTAHGGQISTLRLEKRIG
jgi:hypothetical protein